MKKAIAVAVVIGLIVAIIGVVTTMTNNAYSRAAAESYCQQRAIDCTAVTANMGAIQTCIGRYDWSKYPSLFYECLDELTR